MPATCHINLMAGPPGPRTTNEIFLTHFKFNLHFPALTFLGFLMPKLFLGERTPPQNVMLKAFQCETFQKMWK